MKDIIVHEIIEPKGPLTHRQCLAPKGLLEYVLGCELRKDQDKYYLDVELFSLLLTLPSVKPNIRLVYRREDDSKSKAS